MKGYHHLTRAQRYVIEELLEIGKSYSEIARNVGVHRSTISREVHRNSNWKRQYNALGAHRAAMTRVPHLICFDDRRKIRGPLEIAVREKLISGWSPEQISSRLKIEWGKSVSFQTIYNYVHQQIRFGDTIHHCLRRFGRRKRRYGFRRRRYSRPVPEGKVGIESRPQDANLRSTPGHWERDLVEGKRGTGSLLTIVDRRSRFTVIRKVKSKHADLVNDETERAFKLAGLPCASLTNDNGLEFSRFSALQERMNIPIFFANAYQSWQRGTNENTNGLIRQYFPKGIDFSSVSEEEIVACERQLNARPRRIHNFKTAEEVHFSKNTTLFRTKKEYEKLIQQSE